jgi:polysaccharide pyruvyl transferase WcaK-like protein
MIIAKMKNTHRAKIIITDNVDEYESLIRRLKLLITTRMHPSVMAAKIFLPFISIIYDHKQVGFLQQVGLKTFSIPISKISHANLKLTINKVIQSYDEIKETLKSRVPKLQDVQTTKLLYSILNLIRKY